MNAQATRYKKRPHFRHAEQSELPRCSDHALLAGLRERALAVKAVFPLPAYPVFVALVPDITSPAATSVIVERFEVIDHAAALIRFQNGRTLQVSLSALSWGDSVNPPGFDLVVTLPHEDSDIQSLDDLTRYLTLDSSHWRWCARQTLLSPVNVAQLFELFSETAGEDSQNIEPLAVVAIVTNGDIGIAPVVEQPIIVPIGPKLVQRWTEVATLPSIGKMHFHRRLLPDGIVTEKRERG